MAESREAGRPCRLRILWGAATVGLALATTSCGIKQLETCPGRLIGGWFAPCSKVGNLYQPLPLKEDKALIYVYRPSTMAASAARVDYFLNEQLLTKLSNKTYTHAYVDAGPLTIRAVVGSLFDQKDLVVNTQVEAGQAYFVEHGTSADVTSLGYATQYKFTYTLSVVDPAVAAPRIAQCYEQAPEVEAWR